MSDASAEGLRRAFEGAVGRRAGETAEAEEAIQVLSFSLADEWYGFRLADMVEILGGADPTPIPFTPPFIPGVINHRGSIVTVVDLKKVFGLPTRYRRETGRIVLIRAGDTVIGVEADAISDIVPVRRSEIEPPMSTIEKVKAGMIEGCVRRPRGLLVLLSARALVEELRVRPEG
jgi:purine-binding chemotaxis protein CheW